MNMTVTIKELSSSGGVEIHASGKLHRVDYDQFTPVLERLIREHGKVSILFEMHDFHGWDAKALWEDLKFDVKHFSHFERLAFVGDKTWEKLMAMICRGFTTAKIRYFPSGKEDEARRWLLGGE